MAFSHEASELTDEQLRLFGRKRFRADAHAEAPDTEALRMLFDKIVELTLTPAATQPDPVNNDFFRTGSDGSVRRLIGRPPQRPSAYLSRPPKFWIPRNLDKYPTTGVFYEPNPAGKMVGNSAVMGEVAAISLVNTERWVFRSRPGLPLVGTVQITERLDITADREEAFVTRAITRVGPPFLAKRDGEFKYPQLEASKPATSLDIVSGLRNLRDALEFEDQINRALTEGGSTSS